MARQGTGHAWTQKPPQGTPLDREHPLARGLVAEFVPYGLRPWRDACGNTWVDHQDDGSIARIGGPTGTAVAFINARYYRADPAPTVGSAVTVAAIVYPRATTGVLLAAPTATSAELLLIRTPHADGNVYLNFGGSGAAQLAWTPPGSGFFGAWQKMVFRAGPSGSSIWCGGLRKANQTTAVTRTAKAGLEVGSNPELVVTDAAGLAVEALWVANREWSDAEIADWTAQPYAMYAAPTIRRFFAPVPRARVSQAGAAIVGQGSPKARVSQAGAAIVGQGSPKARISQVGLVVIGVAGATTSTRVRRTLHLRVGSRGTT